MEKFEFIPSGVCSKKMVISYEDGVIKDFEVVGGCNGNLKGIRALIIGRPIDEVAETLKGITCGMKPTSCPDQISKALFEIINNNQLKSN